MKPTIINRNSVRASCPDCEAISVFDFRETGRECGYIIINESHNYEDETYGRLIYRLLKCSGCGRAGLAKFHDKASPGTEILESFFPRALVNAPLPSDIPDKIVNEYREAELCSSFEAWRAASALLRSTLEKTLKENGYTSGSLQQKIDCAAEDGVITPARKRKAHEEIRVLGNDIVHDEWREVNEVEVEASMHYVQRILEDFYDDRETVEKILTEKGHLNSEQE